MPASHVHLGSLTLQPGRQLLAGRRRVPLGRKALDILSLLAEAKGNLVTKDELLAAVWPDVTVEENAVQVHVTALRKALGIEAERLQTVRGLGYRLDLPNGRTAGPSPVPAREPPDSIAVLPFVNLTGDPARDYLADGLAEELICTLSRGTNLKVPARTSTFAYRRRDLDIRHIADELGVATVLEGSVRGNGSRIRVTAQLIDAASGFHLWSGNFDRDVVDLILLEDELARSITEALWCHLEVRRRGTADALAYDLFLRGRALVNRGVPADLRRTIALFEEAIARDPSYVAARTALSDALLYACCRGVLGRSEYEESFAQAQAALAIEPEDAGAHKVIGCGYARRGDWVSAEAHLQTALSIDPDNPDLHAIYGGGFLLFVGHLDRADHHSNRARNLAPGAAITSILCAGVASTRGDLPRALELVSTATKLGLPGMIPPTPAIRARVAFEAGDAGTAASIMAEAWSDALGSSGTEIVELIYQAAAGTAPSDAAARGLGELIRRSRAEGWVQRHQRLNTCLLEWSLMLEERALVRALADITRDAWTTTGLLDLPFFSPFWMPDRQGFRADPHLRTFFEQVGLAEFWRRWGEPTICPAPHSA